MSYILDALQRSSTEEATDSLPSQPQATRAGLSLPWQIAIGAVLATNLIFLYLWQSDKNGTDGNDSTRTTLTAQKDKQKDKQQQPVATEAQSVASTTPNQDYYPPRVTSPDTRKKTLPGIASPRELPTRAPAATQQQTASLGQTLPGEPLPGTAKTFRPTGAPITIAEPSQPATLPAPKPAPQSAPEPALSTAPIPATDTTALTAAPTKQLAAETVAEPEADFAVEPNTVPLQPEQDPLSVAETKEPVAAADSDVSQLYELSDGARKALYVLNFSIHIYSEDADLRAVVVNGKRLLEGNDVIADNGQTFRLLEIFDTGVVVQFEHEGVTETVEIPVNEEWKEA